MFIKAFIKATILDFHDAVFIKLMYSVWPLMDKNNNVALIKVKKEEGRTFWYKIFDS